MRYWTLLVMLAVLAGPLQAVASESKKATAEALFDEARNLMSQGRYEEALQKLKASQELDPGLGTLMNLADCYEKLGRTASAWAEYREIAAVARQNGATEREKLAEEKIKALEPSLSKLTVNVPGSDPSLKVTRNGEALAQAELGVAIPVDPGAQLIEASAPGKQSFSVTVEVQPNGDAKSVDVPPLVASGTSETAASAQALGAGSSTQQADTQNSTQKTWALVALGAGVVGVGVGTYFGLKASSSWSDAKDQCGAYPYDCGSEGKQLEDDARGQATLSTVGFVVGGVLLAGGAALWFTADAPEEKGVALGVGPTNLMLRGSF